jgi:hypothetical protein
VAVHAPPRLADAGVGELVKVTDAPFDAE